MRKHQRSAHFWIWAVLAPLLVLLLVAAIVFRQEYPRNQSEAAQELLDREGR